MGLHLVPPPVKESRATAAFEVIANADEDQEHWLAMRQTLITAGEVPTVLGLAGVRKGRPRLWYEKAGLLAPESLDDVEYAQLGHLFEPINAQLFGAKTHRRVQRSQLLLRSKQYPWLGCTLDYEQWLVDGAVGTPFESDTDGPVPLELKSTGNSKNWPRESEEPTRAYQAQLQAQLVVTGASWGSLSPRHDPGVPPPHPPLTAVVALLSCHSS